MGSGVAVATAVTAGEEGGEMSIETFRMSKKTIARLFVGATVAVVVGAVLGIAALWAALASDAIDLGGSEYIDVNGGSGAWAALALVIVGSLVMLAGAIAAVVSWIAALLNTWQLEDKLWFGTLLAGGLLGVGVIAMIAYVVAGPDGPTQGRLPTVSRAEAGGVRSG
jgi:hypothetical protein